MEGGKGTGSGKPQMQHLIEKEEKYHVRGQLSSLKASGAEEGMGARLLKASPTIASPLYTLFDSIKQLHNGKIRLH